jgi:TonB family protein
MTEAIIEPRSWASRRWLLAVALMLAVQVGFVFWLGERHRPPPRPPATAPPLRLATEAGAELLALHDPTLFALPHRQGFAGSLWLTVPPRELPAFEWNEDPLLLNQSVDQLGIAFRDFAATNRLETVPPEARPEPELTLPATVTVASVSTPSRLRLEGGLEHRRLRTPLELPSWPHSDLLTNSIVQLVLDADGRPESFTLLSSSGLKAADEKALELARTARFVPLRNHSPSSSGTAPTPAGWGRMVFEWQTASQPQATNAPATGP